MPRHGICVGLVSGKGGAGKTSLTAGIGAALAQLGNRTLCVDCDVGLRNLDLAMGLTEQSLMDFTDVAAGRCTLEEAVVEHPLQPGLFLLNAPAQETIDLVTRTQMKALAAHIRTHFDFCLADAPAGMGDGFSLVTAAADRIALVAALDPLSIRDAQRIVMELAAFPVGHARLIVNRVRLRPFRRADLTVDDVMDQAGLPLLGLVPESDAFPQSLRDGLPVTLRYPHSIAARACRRIARRMTGEAVKLPPVYR